MTGRELADLLKQKADEVANLTAIQGFALVLVPNGGPTPTPISLIALDQFAPAIAFVENLSAAMRSLAEPHGAINTYDLNQGFRR